MNTGIGEDLKKIFLAGIGAIATTAEKSEEMIDKLVKKGELTVEDGKTLNQELKHNLSDKMAQGAQMVTKTATEGAVSLLKQVEKMSGEERKKLKEMLAKMDREDGGKKAQ